MSIVLYGLGRDQDVADFASAYGFGILTIIPINTTTIVTYVIPEEFRICPVYREIRATTIDIDERMFTPDFENRITLIEE